MQKKRTARKTLVMPSLYKKDLQAIEDYLLRDVKAEGYKIETDSHKDIESVSELENIEKIKTMDIWIHKPCSVLVSFEKQYAVIGSSDNSVEASGVVNDLYELLKPTQRRILSFCASKLSWIGLAINVVLIIRSDDWVDNAAIKPWILGFAVVAYVWFFVSGYFQLHAFSKIRFENRSSLVSYIKKNRHNIVVTVIVGVVCTVIGTMIGVYLTR